MSLSCSEGRGCDVLVLDLDDVTELLAVGGFDMAVMGAVVFR